MAGRHKARNQHPRQPHEEIHQDVSREDPHQGGCQHPKQVQEGPHSKDITGGEWNTEGKLDTQLIEAVSDVCMKLILCQKVSTREGILDWIRKVRTEIFPGGVSAGQVEQILKVLVMENKVQEVNSTDFRDFSSVLAGEVYYRLAKKTAIISISLCNPWSSRVAIWVSLSGP
ncbi:hypothetical protein Fmac_010849 [Flemingia macrophylla]|uniref:Uncharacterized protein n=1 Tax=Flemingia macrophylla TaxID=520843 RepID=A0ABD1MKR8_9FABA